ncbi:MAG TPA: TMEM175 family protein, partial [Flavobacterium sp.]|nr:TMEM175 family protein [Flavobacterium sp.]
IITIMVLEIRIPEGADFISLQKSIPDFLSYIMSFIYIGIYWNNHHHMLHVTTKVNGKILWANLHLLFWLSMVPFATRWMAENHFAKATLTVYGITLLMAGVAYYILENLIISSQGKNSVLKKAVGWDFKGKSSPVFYITGIAFSFYNGWIAGAIYVFVALMWLIPDKRIEKVVEVSDN